MFVLIPLKGECKKDFMSDMQEAFQKGAEADLDFLYVKFYINCCGFHAVEFYGPKHKDPNMPGDMEAGEDEYMFRFEKIV